jgi:hypothetical protein
MGNNPFNGAWSAQHAYTWARNAFGDHETAARFVSWLQAQDDSDAQYIYDQGYPVCRDRFAVESGLLSLAY